MHQVYVIRQIRQENTRTRTLVCDRAIPASQAVCDGVAAGRGRKTLLSGRR